MGKSSADRFRIEDGSSFELSAFDPRDKAGLASKEEAEEDRKSVV